MSSPPFHLTSYKQVKVSARDCAKVEINSQSTNDKAIFIIAENKSIKQSVQIAAI